MDIKNKVVVITGGSAGLGLALAEVFNAADAKVAITSNNSEVLTKVAAELNLFAISADITKEQEVIAVAEAVVEKFGQIDIWINNAGIWLAHAPFAEMDLNRVHQLVEVNLFGTIHGCRAAFGQMEKQGNGLIVNILSVSALTGRPESSGYCASKYAATGFAKSLRQEVADNKITVINVYPGGMKTDLFNENPPADYENYMEPSYVAARILDNIISQNLDEEQIIHLPKN